MKSLNCLLGIGILLTFISCEKEYSLENSGTPGEFIVGVDCRISKIAYQDTANKGIGAITAAINSLDIVTKITKYDSVSNTIEYITSPVIANDIIYINANEYFKVDFNNRIFLLHGLLDPSDPFSPQFDVNYLYSAGGYLMSKVYTLTAFPGFPVYRVNYSYTGSNLTGMVKVDNISGDTTTTASINYYSDIIAKKYIYIFPDEKDYPYFTQFYNFGLRSFNAVKNITVRNYDPGNILRDSTVSAFSNYVMSRDGYVLSVQMKGDDLQSIPASAGKLSFSYKCK